MSLGLHRWATEPTRRSPPHVPHPVVEETSFDISFNSLILFFVLQGTLAFAALGYVGLKLKWDLTFGMDPGHEHPHIPEEDSIQDNNNVLSVFMVSFSLDTFEPLVLLLLKRVRSKQWHRDIFSALCTLFNGAATGCLFVMVLLQHPPVFGSHTLDALNLTGLIEPMPPAPPPPHSPVFTENELAPLFALTILLSLCKIASYTLRMPQRLSKLP